jgi:hypothetical protein
MRVERAQVRYLGGLTRQPGSRGYNTTARCGDGCLDKLVVSIRHARARKLRVVDGTLRLPQAPEDSPHLQRGLSNVSAQPSRAGLPILLLGLLSGSAPRREMVRCTWMRVPVLQQSVRTIFIVGKASAEARADVLPVDVIEGERMRNCVPPHAQNPRAARRRTQRPAPPTLGMRARTP